MDLVLACNWDEDLVGVAKRHGVTELFGKLRQDAVGGGRVGFILPAISRRQAARYIRRVHDAGIAFNYLLNGTCLGGRELTSRGQDDLARLLGWLHDDCGVAWFTVSIPYLAAFIKRRHPDSHVVVSMMAQVDSVERARLWEEEGAEVLILFDNKDFPLLKALARHTRLRLEVPANLSCMNRCHQTFHHGNLASHASSSAGEGLYSLPLCETRCAMLKVKEPRRILAGQWIRPQDVRLYEEIGVHRLKLLDRISPTAQLTRVVEAYANRAFSGNLAELIPGYRQDRVASYVNSGRLVTMARAFLQPGKYNVFKALPFARRNRSPRFSIESPALDGFLEGVMRRDCRNLSCRECGWCEGFANRAIRFEPGERERFLVDSSENLDELEGGSFFSYLPGPREGKE
ncbi:MAG: hypothetical protein FJ109_17995 [Deltaproteobacteria bacterium]|nr:hypothetical protein [Deltaproteobacteria bacterium]